MRKGCSTPIAFLGAENHKTGDGWAVRDVGKSAEAKSVLGEVGRSPAIWNLGRIPHCRALLTHNVEKRKGDERRLSKTMSQQVKQQPPASQGFLQTFGVQVLPKGYSDSSPAEAVSKALLRLHRGCGWRRKEAQRIPAPGRGDGRQNPQRPQRLPRRDRPAKGIFPPSAARKPPPLISEPRLWRGRSNDT
uniref:Uncharacterized protein n=1 Tax=Sphaerodactylus townsendi TaxID=933632 RepID=A0ACB8FE25_9SAUR